MELCRTSLSRITPLATRWSWAALSSRPIHGRPTPHHVAHGKPVPLAYEEHKPADSNHAGRRPLVIMHGLFGSRTNWKTLSKHYARQRPVYALDLRNHGQSPHSDSMTYEEMADDVMKFLSEQGIDKAHVIGHSMGGKVAMALALKRPDVVDKLVVADIAPVRYEDGFSQIAAYAKAMQGIDMSKIRTRKDAEQILAQTVKSPGELQFLLTNLVRDEDTKQFKWRVNLDTLLKSLPNLADFPAVPGTAHHGETLFVYGEKSNYVRPERVDTIQHLFPRAEMHGMDAGHWVHAERPDEFFKLTAEFLDK